MSSNRPNLILDEQSFQDLLSAAYTIQKHNDQQNEIPTAPPEPEAHSEPDPESICRHCGASKAPDASRCESCGRDEFRPGEKMQSKWASMWLMSQEQDLWPERSPEIAGVAPQGVAPHIAPPPADGAPPNGSDRPVAPSARDFDGSGILPWPGEAEATKETLASKRTETLLDQAFNQPLRRNPALDSPGLDNPTPDELTPGKPALRGIVDDDPPGNGRTPRNPALGTPVLDPLSRHKTQAPGAWAQESFEAASETVAGEASTREPLPHEAHEDSNPRAETIQMYASDDSSAIEALTEQETTEEETTDESTWDEATEITPDESNTGSLLQRFADWRVKLRFQRADVYLGLSVFVAVFALLWPTATSPQPSSLGPWDRALIMMGIAEAPEPAVHLQGDPGIEVWVDPHSALYYCPGEEQYGKTADGRTSTQREAQMDRFEPAGRSACE
jgi:ribosomal protein L40E